MKPAPFDYHRPSSVDEAVATLAATGGKVLAGGQSLVPIMSMRLASPASLVDINHIPGLDGIEVNAEQVHIGALTRHRQLELDAGAFAVSPLLRRSLECVAHPTIRNRGTTVGSLIHADPAAEMPAVLLLLDGSVDVVSTARGARTIAAADLFAGPLESALVADELAIGATFGNPPRGSGTAWVELARRHGDYALVGAGAVVQVDADRRVASARVALISVGPTPILIDVSAACGLATLEAIDGRAVGELVDAGIDPETDIQASADYRRHLARVLTARAVSQAAREAIPA
ncbi:MAG: FAD binding domain-containing protein [Nocardioidaceae bacterium]